MSKGKRWVIGGLIAVVSLFTIIFIIRQAMYGAALSLSLLFVLTNTARASGFRERGMFREAKWMSMLAGFFGLMFVVLLVMMLFF
ncbi:hypothetical protein [Edaphobacillus lindanitolerans]|uniref:Uncharacterized protein n=1 Tax=Edaphobacillus lindanitolerans TaxID=550447 RepID=A0A1U7PPB4_9BACI|nr:hypothetical protein [Edaphobacillus lindanitolerans]SIT89477.1 hypothetical protein SAMN05428946_2419 [Edaphobacillus lindanitolerans]